MLVPRCGKACCGVYSPVRYSLLRLFRFGGSAQSENARSFQGRVPTTNYRGADHFGGEAIGEQRKVVHKGVGPKRGFRHIELVIASPGKEEYDDQIANDLKNGLARLGA